jgi:hypothetical protein
MKKSHEKYVANMEALAKDAFKDHRIRSDEPGRWLIQGKNEDGKWTGFYWAEIINICGGIMVHGDIDTCVFKHYSRPRDQEEDVLDRARWMAKAGVSYLREKASLGMDAKDATLTFDDDVALWEIQQHINECKQEDSPNAEEIAAWQKAFNNLGDEHWYFVQQALYEDLSDAGCDVSEFIDKIGMVPAPRLFYAQAALKKLIELVEEDRNFIKVFS